MGCDIHSFVEVFNNNKWEMAGGIFPTDDVDKECGYGDYKKHPFDWRSYAMFGFLADVRNYSCSPVIAEPRGIPNDLSEGVLKKYDYWYSEAHSGSWLLLKELLDYDYDQTFDGVLIDVRSGSVNKTLREFLGSDFFRDLEIMKGLGFPPDKVRIVFWFDN